MSGSSIYGGIFTPLVTPLTESEQLDLQATEALVEFQLDKGAQGFYVGGSTGECYLQDVAMRKQFLSYIAARVDGRIKLIAHIGANSTALSIELGQHALDCGYDAITSTPPFYYGFGFDEVRDFYAELSAQVALPLLVYYAPSVTGFTCNAEEFQAILDIERVYGIKFTASDMYLLERLKSHRPQISLFHGADEMLLSGLCMGADGGIGSTYNLMVDKYVALHQAFLDGDLAAARQWQTRVNNVTEVLLSVGVIPGIKYLLGRMGLAVGPARRPFKRLGDQDKQLLDACLERHLGSD